MTGTLRERLIALIEPVVADLGCELVDLDLSPGVVRIFVDRAGGVIEHTHSQRVSTLESRR